MITLIAGANGSGKSAWAEELASRQKQGRLVYIATMIPCGEEGWQRVAKHRKQRRETGFITLELPLEFSGAELFPNDTVLLEDVSNLTANMLFSSDNIISAADVLAEINALAARCRHLLVVSIGTLTPADTYDEATNHYIEVLRLVNEKLFNLADTVFQMERGKPLLQKGAWL